MFPMWLWLSKPMVPFWGRCTTHFSLFSWGLGCSLGVRGFDPWPCWINISLSFFRVDIATPADTHTHTHTLTHTHTHTPRPQLEDVKLVSLLIHFGASVTQKDGRGAKFDFARWWSSEGFGMQWNAVCSTHHEVGALVPMKCNLTPTNLRGMEKGPWSIFRAVVYLCFPWTEWCTIVSLGKYDQSLLTQTSAGSAS